MADFVYIVFHAIKPLRLKKSAVFLYVVPETFIRVFPQHENFLGRVYGISGD